MKNTISQSYIDVPKDVIINGGDHMLSVTARLLYILYYDRFKLSRKNGWCIDNEYYLFLTREEAMKLLGVGYKALKAAHEELVRAGFVYEKRLGRGFPNRIFFSPEGKFSNVREEKSEHCQKETQVFSQSSTNNNDKSNNEKSKNEKSKCSSVCPSARVETRLQRIFSECDFGTLSAPVAELFRNVITRMYYSETVRNGKEELPQIQVRRMLDSLTTDHLIEAAEILYNNTQEITNISGFVMAMLINVITGDATAQLIHRPPEYLRSDSFFAANRSEF